MTHTPKIHRVRDQRALADEKTCRLKFPSLIGRSQALEYEAYQHDVMCNSFIYLSTSSLDAIPTVKDYLSITSTQCPHLEHISGIWHAGSWG